MEIFVISSQDGAAKFEHLHMIQKAHASGRGTKRGSNSDADRAAIAKYSCQLGAAAAARQFVTGLRTLQYTQWAGFVVNISLAYSNFSLVGVTNILCTFHATALTRMQ